MHKKLFCFMSALFVVLTLLTGCTDNTDISNVDNSDKQVENITKTESLHITASIHYKNAFTQAQKKFSEKYPDIDVVLEFIDVTDPESTQLLVNETSREMMFGVGSDIVAVDTYSFGIYADVFKMCSAGAFEDLNAYFEADENFNFDGYNTAVIDGMEFNGKQYLLPLYYDLPIFLTEENTLQQNGFKLSECDTGIKLLQSLTGYIQSSTAKTFTVNGQFTDEIWNILDIVPYSFAQPNSIVWDEHIETYMEAYKAYYAADDIANSNLLLPDIQTEGEKICSGEILFADQKICGDSRKQFRILSDIIEEGGTPVLYPVYTADGSGIAARVEMAVGISNTSEYKQESYEFIKCLLSEEAQIAKSDISGSVSEIYNIPVLDSAFSQILQSDADIKMSYAVHAVDGTLDEKSLSPYIKQYEEYMHQTVTAYMINQKAEDIYSLFKSYYNDELIFRIALGNANDRLKIYISE